MRVSFLARFTIVTALATIAVAVTLSYVLSASHTRSIQSDLVGTSFGQASALLTPALGRIDARSHRTGSAYASLAQAAAQITSFQEYVRGMRVYWADGTALYPKDAKPEPLAVRNAIAAQEVVREPVRSAGGERIFTAYSPLGDPAGNEYIAVVALDFSLDQMGSHTAAEGRFVVGTTVGACALIFLSLFALALAAQRELNVRQNLADVTFTQTMSGLAAIVDKRDPYTAGHSQRVAAYAKRLATALKLDRETIKTIENAALLHDLGKIGIPDAVLLKPSKFDDRERAIIKFHPDIAAEILGGVDAMRDVVPCIIHHHERWDGEGYPRRLAAEKIPLGARIICVADAYDAMTTDRPYRRALSVDVARTELLKMAGTQFDERCVRGFVALIDRGAVVPPAPITDELVLARSFGQQLASFETPIA